MPTCHNSDVECVDIRGLQYILCDHFCQHPPTSSLTKEHSSLMLGVQGELQVQGRRAQGLGSEKQRLVGTLSSSCSAYLQNVHDCISERQIHTYMVVVERGEGVKGEGVKAVGAKAREEVG
jgi:hypothetical protein